MAAAARRIWSCQSWSGVGGDRQRIVGETIRDTSVVGADGWMRHVILAKFLTLRLQRQQGVQVKHDRAEGVLVSLLLCR